MTTFLEQPATSVPTPHDAELASSASRALASRVDGDLRVRLDDGQELTLPSAAARLLSHLLTEMGQGNAVTLIPIHAELSTQHAADLLNVSRPHLVKLLESKAIPFHMAGSHRRVRYQDLAAYRARFEEKRQKALEELAAQAEELELGHPAPDRRI